MKSALIIWGGWDGHEPRALAIRFAEALERRCYRVVETCNFSVLLNDDLKRHDVIIPIWSCGIRGTHYLEPLLEAVHAGVGFVTVHGGIDWFEEDRYRDMVGGHYLADTQPENYHVDIVDRLHPVTAGLDGFDIVSEKYHLMTDPQNRILAAADFSGMSMPIAWVKRFGAGKVFYSALAHSVEQFLGTPSFQMALNAIDWASS